jgi:hypothetical protein
MSTGPSEIRATRRNSERAENYEHWTGTTNGVTRDSSVIYRNRLERDLMMPRLVLVLDVATFLGRDINRKVKV